ncbi:MAG: helix-turn-helix transcriptional regulator [Lachnospiraceae bacterium]|nr:helix-turn-helix transcriptional regulator [Lachnospiraceae bacterium]
MKINELLQEKNITKYRLSKISKVPFATISDICTRKTQIGKCTADTLYKLSKALGVTMEALIADSMEHRKSFETFKSNVCHMVKDMGDIDFIIGTLERDEIRNLYLRKWYPECLYMLAMVDYLSRENDIPLCTRYDDMRSAKLREPIYPTSIIAMSAASNSERPKQESFEKAIPEFMRFNIIENEVRNVY